MSEPLNVFIPAAGLGERLLPITDMIPKPLLPILGKPILELVFEGISALPVNKIGINLYHKSETVEEWIRQSAFAQGVRLFPEEILLGTGGALKNAVDLLAQGTFLVHNADIVSDIDLSRGFESHRASGSLATLLVHDRPGLNSVAVDKDGHLTGVGSSRVTYTGEDRRLAFTGIAYYSPEFIDFLPEGVSSVVDVWLQAVSAGYRIGTLDVTGAYWSDIGSPNSYFSTVVDALRAEGENIYIDPSSEGCAETVIDGYSVVEGDVILQKGVSLRNCIVLPGSRPSPGRVYEDCIIGPGIQVDLNGPYSSAMTEEAGTVLIGTGGSDRRYFRMKRGEETAVLMRCREDDPDYRRQIDINIFLAGQNIPVPELREDTPEDHSVLFEDLGDLSLYSWLRCRRKEEEVTAMYKRVIDVLVLIHSISGEQLSACPVIVERIFGYEDLLWETAYFMERFVGDIKEIRADDVSGLDDEFRVLAKKVSAFPQTVMHRDFQSQNIMIVSDGQVRLIDYQGARMGPPAYDLVSVLWDPYHRLEDGQREALIDYYIEKMQKRQGMQFEAVIFRETILPCRLQRHMQALGAYGYLSLVKEKKYFRKYIPEGIRLLKDDISRVADEYPLLNELIKRL